MTLLKKPNGGLVPFRSMLSDFFKGDGFPEDGFWNKDWTPAVNVSEDEKNYAVEVAAPGMKKDDFKVKVDRGILTISAERKEEKEEKKKNFTRQEYSYNSFSRSFTLPDDAREDDVKAHYEDGVLKLSIARKALAPASKAKEIAVV
jgi:HSP20 family protein